MPACKKCGLPFIFKKRKGYKPYERGAFVALHPTPDRDGVFELVDDRIIAVFSPWREGDPPRYLKHEQVCKAERTTRRSPLDSERGA